MHMMISALISSVEGGAAQGMIALTLVRFYGTSSCRFRIWCADFRPERLNMEFELLHTLHEIHAIEAVDGIEYPFFARKPHEELGAQDESRRPPPE
jgi:hypothetical protein